jgi:hypothetical protein
MEYLLAVIVFIAAVGYLVFLRKKRKKPQDTYVCDICGQTECLCHKEEKE